MAPRPRFTKLEPDKQERILEAALDEFVEHGFEEASLNRIIAAAGISKGAMYYYFDDKADLFATVFKNVMSELMKELDMNVNNTTRETFWTQLLALGHQGSEMMQRNPKLLALARAYYSLPVEMRTKGPLADAFAEPLAWARELIVHGQELGLVRTDLPLDILMELLMAMDQVLDRWVISVAETLSPEEMQRTTDICFQLQRRLISPPRGDEP